MLLLFLAAAAAPAPPSSPTAPPAPQVIKPDPATVAEAMRLLDAESFEENVLNSSELTVGAMLAGMVEQLRKNSGEEVPEDFVTLLRDAMHDHAMDTVRANMPRMKREAAEIYAQEFTQAELIHLRELASDPVLIKVRKRHKVMEPKLMMIGIRTMRDAQPELEAKLKRLISDYLATHGKAAGNNKT